MHLLHRSSILGGGRAARRVGGAQSSPRAAAPLRQHLFTKSDSIKKRSAAAKGSKRARLRAGLAAALQDLKLAGRRHKRRPSPGSAGATQAQLGSQVGYGFQPACRDAGPPCDAAPASSGPEGTTASGGKLLIMMALLALLCVVALGRAPAVCCCTCAAWWCRGASAGGRSVVHVQSGYGGGTVVARTPPIGDVGE